MATETTSIAEKSVSLSHGRTRYFEAGSGYPTILLHGAGFENGADTWLTVMPGLARDLRVLAPDSLNWGPGDPFDAEFSFAYLVDHVREFMDALGIEKANIVGHSMGGWIATLFGYESPNRINKLVVVAAGGTATRPLATMVEWQPPEVEAMTARLAKRLANSPLPADAIIAEYVETVRDPKKTEGFAKVMRHMTNPLTRQRYNTLRRLPFIKLPTLVVWGRNDQVNALEMGEQLNQGIAGSKLIVYDDTGHGVPHERPAEFTKDVLDFLK
ncbi:MAG TPA: alpha/beta hydrolase [Dehalococcoidia bacterium]|nr:alpha/beta hydrolase [Dehalococcoidia bacterium]